MSVASFANTTDKQKFTQQCRPQFTDAETSILSSMMATHTEGGAYEGMHNNLYNDELEVEDVADEGEDDDHSIASTSTNGGSSTTNRKEKKIKQQPQLLKLGCQDLFACDSDTFSNAVKN